MPFPGEDALSGELPTHFVIITAISVRQINKCRRHENRRVLYLISPLARGVGLDLPVDRQPQLTIHVPTPHVQIVKC